MTVSIFHLLTYTPTPCCLFFLLSYNRAQACNSGLLLALRSALRAWHSTLSILQTRPIRTTYRYIKMYRYTNTNTCTI